MNAKAGPGGRTSGGSSPVVDAPRARAQARYVRMTPMKARRVVDLIRGRDAASAAAILEFAPQAASGPVAKLLASAVANAENNHGLDPDTLVVETAFVDEGPTLKRFQPRAQGRAFRIRKRTSHITLELVSVEGRTGAARPDDRRRAARVAGQTSQSAAGSTEEATKGRRDRGDRSAKGRTR